MQTQDFKDCFQQGKQHRQNGNIDEAIQCFRETIRLKADFVPAYNNLANALQTDGKIDEAIDIYEQALILAPKMAVLHCNLASLWQIQADNPRAIAGYQHAIKLKPDFFLAHHNLAKALSAERDFDASLSAFQSALRLQPDSVEAQIDCGSLYHQHGYIQEAIDCYKAAIRLEKSARAYNSLGAALQQWGEMTLSKSCYQRTLKLQPEFDLAHYNLGQIFEAEKQFPQAQYHYEQALAMRPDNIRALYYLNSVRVRQADWDNYDARVCELIASSETHLKKENVESILAMLTLMFPLPMTLRKSIAEHLAQHHAKNARNCSSTLTTPTDAKPARLKIAYVSPDFRGHPVGMLVCEIFQHHQRPDFEVFAYSLVPVMDEWTQSIRQGCDHFIDVSKLAPLKIAQRINADGIHILIDLAGYTTNSCTDLFAYKPAPIQIQYLGYPSTMGADYIPYILADRQLIPEAMQAHYSEEIIYLPHAWVSPQMKIAETRLSRHDFGLPENSTVFCCFNGIYKIEPSVFAVWMQILEHVPKSILWLVDSGESVNEKFRQVAIAANIQPERLIFAANLPHAEYLARYRLADLFLDTFIYNAGATAVGALAAGLPILTCPHESYASRMGASLCYAVGLPELVCDSSLSYQKLAIELGNDRPRLAALKIKLIQLTTTSSLFKPAFFALELEQVFRKLWKKHSEQNNLGIS